MSTPKTAHGTLTANTVTTVSLSMGYTVLEVVNRTYDGGAIWVRLDGIDPEIGGDDSYVVLGARTFDRLARFDSVTVKLISDAPREFSCEVG